MEVEIPKKVTVTRVIAATILTGLGYVAGRYAITMVVTIGLSGTYNANYGYEIIWLAALAQLGPIETIIIPLLAIAALFSFLGAMAYFWKLLTAQKIQRLSIYALVYYIVGLILNLLFLWDWVRIMFYNF